jgi:mRNA-degrading endonuclease toxin of MazEF toxin-antitoxin module
VVNFDHIQTVPKRKVGRLIATRSTEKMNRATQAIAFALGLDELLMAK